MKIAYFDCPTGISGNMILAAFLDAGLTLPCLKKELGKLKLKGYQIKFSKTSKNGFAAKHLDVMLKRPEPARSTKEILDIIRKSGLKKSIRDLSLKIFGRLIKAESQAHGRSMAHLHETGGTDAIVDIVGCAVALDKLGISEVYCSALPFGIGRIRSAHGLLPNPAPATLKLLKGVPTYRKNIKAELVTPTGAAIITTITESFTDMPKLKLERTGMGAGTYDLKEPNILRLFIGEAQAAYEEDLILSIETNIDNMNPEFYEHIINKLMERGALDAYITPVQMKKNRPGVTLTVLSDLKNKEKLIDQIFSETTTLGVRTYLIKREKLEREIKKVRTKYGVIRVKIGKTGGQVKNIAPEYKDCVKLSRKFNVPIKSIYNSINQYGL